MSVQQLIDFIGNTPIANLELTCKGCKRVRLQQYNKEINLRRLNCKFELFEDLKQQDDLENFTQRTYECHFNHDISSRLVQIIQDFKVMIAEKKYTEIFKTKTEAAEFLLEQGWIPDGELMRFPVGRLFTIECEIDAIHKLTDGHEQINFKYFAVVIPQAGKVGTK